MKILCVDNYPAQLESLIRELHTLMPSAGMWAFRDTTTALEFVEENGCDVLFCEIDLYDGDGIVFAEEVQKLNPRVNIIFVTVCEERERAKDVIKLRPSGYITKPYTRDQLSRELNHLRYPVEASQTYDAFSARDGYDYPAKDKYKFSVKDDYDYPAKDDYDYPEKDDYDYPIKDDYKKVESKLTEEKTTKALNAKDLRRLSRVDLLEMLILQTKENDRLTAKINEIEKQLVDKEIKIAKAGSIAQAALSVYGVFESAQKAADEYLDNVRSKKFDLERLEKEAKQRAEATVKEAKVLCDRLLRETETKCEEMKLKAKIETEKQWEALREKTDSYLKEHEALRTFMGKYL